MHSFIEDIRTFGAAKDRVSNVFHVDSNLPEQVFQDEYKWFAFEEFDWALSGEFWAAIQNLTSASNDESLLMAVLDPDPEKYFKKEFGYYNWVDIPVSLSSQQYWNLLNEHPPDSPADALLFNSNKIVWLPKSAKWAIWGERRYEICVLGCRERIPFGSWQNLDRALASYLPNAFRPRGVPNAFREGLERNYGVQPLES